MRTVGPRTSFSSKGGTDRKFAAGFSQILAEKAAGTALVVVPGEPSRWQNPSDDSVWSARTRSKPQGHWPGLDQYCK